MGITHVKQKVVMLEKTNIGKDLELLEKEVKGRHYYSVRLGDIILSAYNEQKAREIYNTLSKYAIAE